MSGADEKTAEDGVPNVFLSYARPDEACAAKLVYALEQAGLEVWWDARIEGGAEFAKSIEAALDACDAVVVLWSSISIHSDWVLDEASRARQQHKLVPVSLDETEPPLGFGQYQIVNLKDWSGDPTASAIAAIVRGIRGVAGRALHQLPAKSSSHVRVPSDLQARRLPQIAGVVAVGVVMAALLFLTPKPGVSPSSTSTTSPDAAATVRLPSPAVQHNSIAVLPLVPLPDDEDSSQFADGLSEELINYLATIPQLRVTSRTSAFSFKKTSLGVGAVAQQLGVAHILEGSVRRAGDRLRIALRLIDAQQDRQLWADTYDRNAGDFFAIQDDIAGAVAEAMQVTLAMPLPTARETRADAFALYVQAKSLARKRSPEGLRQAETLLKQAVEIDPELARAWNRLSIIYTDQADLGLMPREEGYSLARMADEQAIIVDGRYAASYAGLAWIALSYDHDLVEAARFLQRALDLAPHNATALSDAAALLKTVGRLDDAIAIEEFNVLRDPLSPGRHNNLAASYYYAGRLSEAETHFRRVLELSPKYSAAHMRLGMVLLAQGDPQAAAAVIEQEVNEAARLYGLAVAYDALGRRDGSDALLSELASKYPEEIEHVAQVHALRGDADTAFQVLEGACGRGEVTLRDFRVDPRWDRLRQDSRWPAILECVGVSDAQVSGVQLEVSVH